MVFSYFQLKTESDPAFKLLKIPDSSERTIVLAGYNPRPKFVLRPHRAAIVGSFDPMMPEGDPRAQQPPIPPVCLR